MTVRDTGSRYTAARQYGMVGFGAGPVGTVMAPGNADAAAGISATAGAAPNGLAAVSNLVMPPGVRIIEDPTFWLVATLGAVIVLAGYSAGPSG